MVSRGFLNPKYSLAALSFLCHAFSETAAIMRVLNAFDSKHPKRAARNCSVVLVTLDGTGGTFQNIYSHFMAL